MTIVNLYDRDVELFYEEQILENKKEYSKSWSKILHIFRDLDARPLPTSASSSGLSTAGSSYELSQQLSNMKLKDKERQAIKDKFAVSLLPAGPDTLSNQRFPDVQQRV